MNGRVAVVGASLVGRSWAIVFARAGFEVRLWDTGAAVLDGALDAIATGLAELAAAGLLEEPGPDVLARIVRASSLGDAVAGAVYVQESAAESLDVKKAIFRDLDAAAPPDCVLASSTSTIRASLFAAELPGRHRCLVAHPINPPHLVPIVEICPADFTDPDVTRRAYDLHHEMGRVPILVKREIDGFILNRLQAALLAESWRLVAEGYVSADDLDKTVRDGLGLRWSFMGPFETIDLNAAGGIAEYARLYGRNLQQLVVGGSYEPLADKVIAVVAAERRAILPTGGLGQRQAWRDTRLAQLIAHKAAADGDVPVPEPANGAG